MRIQWFYFIEMSCFHQLWGFFLQYSESLISEKFSELVQKVFLGKHFHPSSIYVQHFKGWRKTSTDRVSCKQLSQRMRPLKMFSTMICEIRVVLKKLVDYHISEKPRKFHQFSQNLISKSFIGTNVSWKVARNVRMFFVFEWVPLFFSPSSSAGSAQLRFSPEKKSIDTNYNGWRRRKDQGFRSTRNSSFLPRYAEIKKKQFVLTLKLQLKLWYFIVLICFSVINLKVLIITMVRQSFNRGMTKSEMVVLA